MMHSARIHLATREDKIARKARCGRRFPLTDISEKIAEVTCRRCLAGAGKSTASTAKPWAQGVAESSMRPRADGRMDLIKMPFSPEAKDRLPMPIDHNGRRKRWVGFGFTDEGPANGTEPLVYAVGE